MTIPGLYRDLVGMIYEVYGDHMRLMGLCRDYGGGYKP